jgi:hypothetical protein
VAGTKARSSKDHLALDVGPGYKRRPEAVGGNTAVRLRAKEEANKITLKDLKKFWEYWNYTKTIEGWLTRPEALLLFVKSIEPGISTILEIGCWQGRSSSLFAQISRDYGLRFITVDDFSGSGELWTKRKHIKERFLRNMHGLRFELHHPDDLPALIRTERIGLVYIDGSHCYESVKSDIKGFLPTARCIIGHDYSLPDVQKAVNEVIPSKSLPVFDMWMWEKRSP